LPQLRSTSVKFFFTHFFLLKMLLKLWETLINYFPNKIINK
jgi:hypothetical protein